LDVREAGHRLPPDDGVAGACRRITQDGDTMAQRTGDLAGFEEFGDLLLQSKRLFEGEHRTLASRNDNRIESCQLDVNRLARVLDESHKPRCSDEPHADQVAGRIAARITRIAQRIRLTFAALGAEYLDFVPLFSKAQV